MDQLKNEIEKDIENAYELSGSGGVERIDGKYFYVEKEFKTDVNIRVIQKLSELGLREHLIQILDRTEPEVAGNYGRAPFFGKRIFLNEKHIHGIVSNQDDNTVPHELGHTGNLQHPDELNSDVEQRDDPIKSQNIPIVGERKNLNLMHSGTHIGTRGNDKYSTNLEIGQMDILARNYKEGKLNQDNITPRNEDERQELEKRSMRYLNELVEAVEIPRIYFIKELTKALSIIH
jgi:hypothetical protein